MHGHNQVVPTTRERRDGWRQFTLLSEGLKSRTKTNLINLFRDSSKYRIIMGAIFAAQSINNMVRMRPLSPVNPLKDSGY